MPGLALGGQHRSCRGDLDTLDDGVGGARRVVAVARVGGGERVRSDSKSLERENRDTVTDDGGTEGGRTVQEDDGPRDGAHARPLGDQAYSSRKLQCGARVGGVHACGQHGYRRRLDILHRLKERR